MEVKTRKESEKQEKGLRVGSTEELITFFNFNNFFSFLSFNFNILIKKNTWFTIGTICFSLVYVPCIV